jgi:predicted nuclease with TOPRIM domain
VPQDGPPAFGVQAPRVYADLPKQGSPLAQDVKLAELQQEMEKLCKEREHVAAVKSTLELAARALEQERAAFEAQKVWLQSTFSGVPARLEIGLEQIDTSSLFLDVVHPDTLLADETQNSCGDVLSRNVLCSITARIAFVLFGLCKRAP